MVLGHRRLAIIDLTDGGWQPMASADERYWLTYNGELYNYVELRKELEDLGHRFSSESDTEVLLTAWSRWGAACLPRFRGMFAFALLDSTEQTLHLARDAFGIKPLFYADGDGLVFASEIPAMLEHPSVSRQIDPQRLYDYLRWGLTDHDDGTMFADVKRLPPAHHLRFDLQAGRVVDIKPFWVLRPERRDLSFEDAAAGLRERFVESVRLHLRSDVPVGMALSGGIDSSAITCVSRLLAGPDADLHCFSYLAEDPRYDEQRWIELAADAAGARLHTVRLDSGAILRDLDDLVRSQGEPFGSTSILAQRHVFRLAQEAGVTVLLDGQGADELFAGYRSYLAAQFVTLVRSGRISAAARLARSVTQMPGTDVDARTVLRVLAGVLPPSVRGPLLRAAGRRPFPPWLRREWFEARGIGPRDAAATGTSGLDRVLETAFSATSLPALLRYEDRNSMTWSRESRVPFLETDLVEYVFSLPREHLVGEDGASKLVFRSAMRGIVPDAILDRRDKIGFNTPEDVWLRRESSFVREVLNDGRALPFLDVDASIRQWDQLTRGRRRFDWQTWRWLNTVTWMKTFEAAA